MNPRRITVPWAGEAVAPEGEWPAGLHDYDEKTWVGNTRLGASTEAAFEALRHNATPWQGNVRIDKTG